MRLRILAWGTGVVFLLAATAASAATIAVPAGGDFQAALDAAQPGDVITLEPNATFVGNFVLPNKGKASDYITIRSAAPDSAFPDSGVRMTPAYAALLPKIKSPNALQALLTAVGAHHYKLMFLEFQANLAGAGEIIAIGAGDSTQTDPDLSHGQVPYAFVLDRLYVHGDPELGQKRCISLNSSDTTVINSWVSDCKAINQDSQAISGFNGPGNWLIENNYLEAAAENILIGGADPPTPNLVTTNVVVRYNYMSKPRSWRDPILAAPPSVTAAATPSAGILPAGTYYYKVVARKVSNQGKIAASVATTEVSATLDANGAVTISWTPVATAQEYLVYGRTSNTQSIFWTTTDPFFTDAGQDGTAGKPGSGTKWSVKNIFELKNAQDVLVENNVFENLWVADQPGYPIVFTPRNQSGHAPWSVVQRVMFRNNVVRHTAGGVNILGTDNLAPSQLTNHITIVNNIFDDLTAGTWGTARVFQLGVGPVSVTIDHNLAITTQTNVYWLYGGTPAAPTYIPDLTITNNMSLHNSFGLNGNNKSTGVLTYKSYISPDLQPPGKFCGNVLAGRPANLANRYLPKDFGCDNFFPTIADWQNNFMGYAAGDYRLLPTSIYAPCLAPNYCGEHSELPGAGPDVAGVMLEAALALSGDIRLRPGMPPVRIIPPTLPNGMFNVPYAQSLSCTPGFGPCAWEVLDSSMPAGLAFDPLSGLLSGTPLEPTAGLLIVRAFDTSWSFNDAIATLPITVDPPILTISLPEVPAARVGEPFQFAPSVSGTLGSVSWTVASGTLPAGVTLDALSGAIAGTPTMWGTTSAVIQVLDSDRWNLNRTVADTLTITVVPAPIVITTDTLPSGDVPKPYRAELQFTGGTGSVMWTLVEGRLPEGLTLSPDGVISGKPRVVGTFSFTAQARDTGWTGIVATHAISVTIRAREVVLYALDANAITGTWSLVADATAAGGMRLWNPNKSAGKVSRPLPDPANYFEISFQAEAGVAYHLWLRGKADRDKRNNDAVFVQFSASVDAAGTPTYRIGTKSGTLVNLADCNGCHLSGWGWQDNGFGVNVMGPAISFAQSGAQTIRVQVKQDGFSIDQIVLSAGTFLTAAPGALKNDATIVER